MSRASTFSRLAYHPQPPAVQIVVRERIGGHRSPEFPPVGAVHDG